MTSKEIKVDSPSQDMLDTYLATLPVPNGPLDFVDALIYFIAKPESKLHRKGWTSSRYITRERRPALGRDNLTQALRLYVYMPAFPNGVLYTPTRDDVSGLDWQLYQQS